MKLIGLLLLAALAGGGLVFYVMSGRGPETMKPAVDVNKIGAHALMPEHEGSSDDSWMNPEHRQEHARVEQSVFFTESGLYSKADIAKNGPLAPVEKYKGITSRHDFKPQKGDLVCPITQTKANPKFTWWVHGKLYTFCCPPCIEEFVIRARDKPNEIKDPDAYRMK